jgi:hypothetical protein
VPDADRLLMSLGASIDVGDMVADVALMGVAFFDRDSELAELPASYENFALLTGLAIHYASER